MNPKRIETAFFFVLLLVGLVLAFLIFLPYLGSLILAATMAVIFYPIYRRLWRLLGKHAGLAALLTVILVLVIVAAPLVFFGIQVFDEAAQVYSRIAGGQFSVSARLWSFLPVRLQQLLSQFSFDTAVYVKSLVDWITANLGSVFSSITGILAQFFMGILALFYFLRDGEKIVRAISSLLPLAEADTGQILGKLRVAITAVIRGSLVVALLQGIVAGIGFTIFGVPHPAFWGSLTVIAALVPTLGTSLVVAPAIGYLLFTQHAAAALGLFIWGMVAIGLIDNFLSPKLIERGVKVHPLLILVSVLGGISFFGPIGFLLGPLTLSFLFALLDIYPAMVGGKSQD